MEAKRRTEIAQLGQFGLIDRLAKGARVQNSSTMLGIGDDAAVIDLGGNDLMLTSCDTLFEGVDFDLTYFPLKHLGYKAVMVGANDILAMNGRAEQVMISLGLSSKLPVEAIDDLYDGVRAACDEMGIDLVGGDTRASLTGLVIGVTAIGRVGRDKITRRSGAKCNDLICITGSPGAAYLGLQLLERERQVLSNVDCPEPQFAGYEYLLESYLKPRTRFGVIDMMAEEGLVPSAMIDMSDGLASDLLQICKSSQCGARIYLERIPIAKQLSAFAAEINMDPVVAALNGGEDHELIFTVPLEQQELISKLGCIDVIGHITEPQKGAFLVTPDGSDILLRSQGFPDGLLAE